MGEGRAKRTNRKQPDWSRILLQIEFNGISWYTAKLHEYTQHADLLMFWRSWRVCIGMWFASVRHGLLTVIILLMADIV